MYGQQNGQFYFELFLIFEEIRIHDSSKFHARFPLSLSFSGKILRNFDDSIVFQVEY